MRLEKKRKKGRSLGGRAESQKRRSQNLKLFFVMEGSRKGDVREKTNVWVIESRAQKRDVSVKTNVERRVQEECLSEKNVLV